MPKYIYQARGARGDLMNGLISAANEEEAGRKLRAEGRFVVKLSEANDGDLNVEPVSLEKRARKVRRRDVIFVAHQLSAMVDTGVPLSEALDSLVMQCQSPDLKAVLSDVMATVQAGGEFSSALRKFPKVFPPVMIGLIRAGEVSGSLGRMLEIISKYLDKELKTVRQAKGAMMYPLFMLGMTLLVTAFIMMVVLPKFAKIYGTRQAALPGPTQVLMGIHTGMTEYWYLCLGGIVALVVTLWALIRTHPGRRVIDWCKLHAPVARGLFTSLYLTRSTRTMGTMLNAGVPLLDVIGIVRHVTQNVFYDELWDTVDDKLRQGSQLSEPLFASFLIPRSISQMIYSGEKAGRLGQAMSRVAEFTESEFDDAVKTATQFIEPVMVVVMGGIIGFVAIALLMPIFSVGQVMAG